MDRLSLGELHRERLRRNQASSPGATPGAAAQPDLPAAPSNPAAAAAAADVAGAAPAVTPSDAAALAPPPPPRAPSPDAPAPPPVVATAAPQGQLLDRSEFECALCMKLFWEPLALHCGHTFCRACIKRSLAMQAACPLCRGACHINAAEVRPNLLLTKVIEERFAGELVARARDAAEDEAELNRARLGLFLLPSTGGLLLFPGTPLLLHVWEQRYLALMHQCLENRSEFGVQPDAATMHGAAMRIVTSEVARGVGGTVRLFVRAVVHARYRCLTQPVASDGGGEYGLVVAPLVEYIEDLPIDDEGGAEADAATVAALVNRLPPPARRALQEVGRAAQAQMLVSVCAAAVARIIASVGSRAEAVLERHGPLPPPTGPQGGALRWSFFLADALALPLEAKLRCFNSTSTLERLLEAYAFLRAADDAARGGDGAAGGDEGVAAALPPLASVSAEAALLVFQPSPAGPPLRLETIGQAVAAAVNSPLASSIAVFVFIFGLLWLAATGRVVF